MVLENLEKETKAFIKKLATKKGPPLYKLSVEKARKVLDDLQSGPVEKLSVRIENHLITQGTHKKISIRIVRPADAKESLPVIMYFHGGGWILGNENTHDRLVREIACGANAAVVFVNYTPSPEAKFSKIIEQALGATQYIAAHGKEFNLDSSRFAVVGDSVGGNMASVVTLLAIQGGLKIDYLALFYPVTDANFNTSSYKEFAKGPWLTKEAMKWFWKAYAPNAKDRKKSIVSPLRATLKQLKDFPPTLIITDDDVLRDEGEAFAHKLMQAGVEVTAIRFLGTIHDFMMLNPLRNTPAARAAIALATHHLQEALKSQKRGILEVEGRRVG